MESKGFFGWVFWLGKKAMDSGDIKDSKSSRKISASSEERKIRVIHFPSDLNNEMVKIANAEVSAKPPILIGLVLVRISLRVWRKSSVEENKEII